jgi:hypothetical protein
MGNIVIQTKKTKTKPMYGNTKKYGVLFGVSSSFDYSQ